MSRSTSATNSASRVKDLDTSNVALPSLKEAFSVPLTLFEWQERVIKIRQDSSKNLREYSYAKIWEIETCPVMLTDVQKIDYLLQGLI
ncbi:hypothetical protein MRX96_048445 [Rhipicephalus microplus]